MIRSAAGRVGLAALLAVLGGCRVEVLHDLDEGQANEVLHALGGQGIQGDKQRVTQGTRATYSVSVPRGSASSAWELLRKQNLPRTRHEGWGEVFGDVGLVPTTTQEQALLRHAISGELSRTLESLDGVRLARVHVVLPARERLGDVSAPPRPRAAVLLKVRDASPISEEAVRRLVAGAVDGLEPAAVAVVVAKSPGSGAHADPPPLASVGPFEVGRSSRGPLLATLVAAVLAICVVSLFAVWALRRGRRRVRAQAGPGPQAAAAELSEVALQLGALGRTSVSALTGQSGAGPQAGPAVSRTSNRSPL